MAVDHIVVEGLIGAGKTTLARRLATQRHARLVLEEFDENPFLARFYEDPARYAFTVELAFLAQRYQQLKRSTEQDLFHPCTVADYSLPKSLIFASVTLQADEHALFRDLFDIMYGDLPSPDLIIYLHLGQDRLRERIRERGRSYEQHIQSDYLLNLQERYMDHLRKAKGSRVLVVDLGDTDLLHDGAAYATLNERIDASDGPSYEVLHLGKHV